MATTHEVHRQQRDEAGDSGTTGQQPACCPDQSHGIVEESSVAGCPLAARDSENNLFQCRVTRIGDPRDNAKIVFPNPLHAVAGAHHVASASDIPSFFPVKRGILKRLGIKKSAPTMMSRTESPAVRSHISEMDSEIDFNSSHVPLDAQDDAQNEGFAYPVNSAWDDTRRSVMNAYTESTTMSDLSHDDQAPPSEGISSEAFEGAGTDAIGISICWFLTYIIGLFSLSPVWMMLVVILCFHILHMRWKLVLQYARHRPLIQQKNFKPAIADQGIWVNAFIADIWPRHLYMLEQRLQASLSKHVSEFKATGISSVKLLSLKILRGRPRVSHLRSHAGPPASGGTSDRARPGDDMDQILDAEVDFDGLVEMMFFVQLLMGSVRVRVRLTSCEATSRLRFYNRLDSQPFYGGFTAEVLPDPEPIFAFDVKVGYVTASRVPFVEDFFLSQMQGLIRKSRVDFRLRRTEAEPEPKIFTPEGILVVSVLGCSPLKNGQMSSIPKSSVVIGTPDDSMVGRRLLHTATAVEIIIGQQKGICVLGSPSSNGATTAFPLSSWNNMGGPSTSAAALHVRILEHDRELGKGRAFIDDILMIVDTQCIEWDIVLKPRSLGKLRVSLLWEPLVVQRLIRPDMTRYGLLLWSNARSGLCQMMSMDDDVPTEFCGVVRVKIRKAGLLVEERKDNQNEDVTTGLPLKTSSSSSAPEWNPFVTVAMGGEKLATKPPGKQSGLPIMVQFSEVFEFLLSIDSFSTTQVVFRLYDRRWSSSSLLGSASLDVSDLIFRHNCMLNTRLDLENCEMGYMDVLVTFQPTSMLQRLGHRAAFFEQNMIASSITSSSEEDVSSSSQSSSLHSSPISPRHCVELKELSPSKHSGGNEASVEPHDDETLGASEQHPILPSEIDEALGPSTRATWRDIHLPKNVERETSEFGIRRRRRTLMKRTKNVDDAISSQKCLLM